MALPLACPKCAARYEMDERFCAKCGMPLTYAGRVDVEQYAHGPLRRVATGRQQPEAEFIQMLLLDEGIPSTLRRSAGFDVPDMLAAGPRDVLVPESGVEVARQVLLQGDLIPQAPGTSTGSPPPGVLLAGLLLALGVVAVLVWLVLNAG